MNQAYTDLVAFKQANKHYCTVSFSHNIIISPCSEYHLIQLLDDKKLYLPLHGFGLLPSMTNTGTVLLTMVNGIKLVPVKQCIWAATSEFGTYCLCEQRRFRRACASAQSRQNLHCSLIQAVSREEP